MDTWSDLPPPSAEVIADNVDLMTLILLLLPAKSLVRFKSVSKRWFSLISDSNFAANHHSRTSILGFFFRLQYANPSYKWVSIKRDPTGPSLDYLHQIGSFHRTKIINSCKGLLLCECSQVLCNVYVYHYLVCNPTTQAYTVIPEPKPFGFPPQSVALLAFDPSKSPRYKVVFLRLYIPYVGIDIYCSETESWKQIRAPCRSLSHPVFCSGAIYWFGFENLVSGFDVDSEKMIEMKEPLTIRAMDVRYFGESGGRLILIQTRNVSAMAFEILEMGKDDCGWIVKCCVNLGPLQSVSPQLESVHRKYCILCVVKRKEEKDYALVLAFPEKTIYYSPKCNSWNVLDDIYRGRYTRFDAVFPYVESLYPL